MYITQDILDQLECKYGVPEVLHTGFGMSCTEFDLLKWSMRNRRRHDVTLFISKSTEDKIAVIRKPSYPPDIYRPPSGGIELGEDFETGAQREAYEETGLEIELHKYLLKVHVDLAFQGEVVPWTSHVFSALATGGCLRPVDTKEIADARWATIDELKTDLLTGLQQSESAGLQYRALLQTAALKQYGEKAI